jgi:hypothetical protein
MASKMHVAAQHQYALPRFMAQCKSWVWLSPQSHMALGGTFFMLMRACGVFLSFACRTPVKQLLLKHAATPAISTGSAPSWAWQQA